MPYLALRRRFIPALVVAVSLITSAVTLVEPAMAADFAPIPLDRLIGTSTAIVLGDVATVKDGTFTLRVTQTLAGRVGSEIEIRQYIPSRFEGTPRPAPYKAGQSFLLFLVSDGANASGAWKILGAGGEGEMPVDRGFAYFHGRNVPGFPSGTYRVHDAERNIQRVELPSLLDAVKGYRACFEWKPGSGEQTPPAGRCDAAALEAFAKTSAIHRHLSQLTATRLKSRG